MTLDTEFQPETPVLCPECEGAGSVVALHYSGITLAHEAECPCCHGEGCVPYAEYDGPRDSAQRWYPPRADGLTS